MAAAVVGTLAGAALGLVAGLVPGLHTNNLSGGILAARAPFLAVFAALLAGPYAAASDGPTVFGACGFLFGIALGHAFTDEIPAVFLGAPGPDTALSVLPGHRLLMAGLGASAVRAAALGSLLGILLSLPLVPLLAGLMGPPLNVYERALPVLPALLLAVAGALVLSERGSKMFRRPQARMVAAGLLLVSGALGEAAIFRGIPVESAYPFGAPPAYAAGHLLSVFAGLFGLPTLLIAARSATRAPEIPAKGPALPLEPREVARAAAAGTLAGAVVGWLPGVGAAQASVLAKMARDRLGQRPDEGVQPMGDAAEFLVTQSAAAAANLMFNLVALFALLRVRSGTMGALKEVGGSDLALWADLRTPPLLLLGLIAGTVASLPLCYGGALWLGAGCSRVYRKLPPRALSASVFVALVALILALEGTVGLAVAGAAVLLGLVPPLAGIKRTHLMGAILLPVALRFSGAA